MLNKRYLFMNFRMNKEFSLKSLHNNLDIISNIHAIVLPIHLVDIDTSESVTFYSAQVI